MSELPSVWLSLMLSLPNNLERFCLPTRNMLTVDRAWPHIRFVRSSLKTWDVVGNYSPDHWVLENEQVKLADGEHIAGSPFALLVSTGPASARSSVCENCQEVFSTGNFSLNSTKLLRLTAR